MPRSLIYIINNNKWILLVYNPAAMQPAAGCLKNQSDRELCKKDSQRRVSTNIQHGCSLGKVGGDLLYGCQLSPQPWFMTFMNLLGTRRIGFNVQILSQQEKCSVAIEIHISPMPPQQLGFSPSWTFYLYSTTALNEQVWFYYTKI